MSDQVVEAGPVMTGTTGTDCDALLSMSNGTRGPRDNASNILVSEHSSDRSRIRQTDVERFDGVR